MAAYHPGATGVRCDITNNAWNDAWNVAMRVLRAHCDPRCYCKATWPLLPKATHFAVLVIRSGRGGRCRECCCSRTARPIAGLRPWGAISTSSSEFLDHMHHPWRQHVAAGGENARQFSAQEARPLPHRDPAVQQEGTNLIDDTGALADQSCSNPVQRLQVELLGCLGVQALQEEGRGDPQTSFLTASATLSRSFGNCIGQRQSKAVHNSYPDLLGLKGTRTYC
jgi:hypothetical protein